MAKNTGELEHADRSNLIFDTTVGTKDTGELEHANRYNVIYLAAAVGVPTIMDYYSRRRRVE